MQSVLSVVIITYYRLCPLGKGANLWEVKNLVWSFCITLSSLTGVISLYI